MFEWQDPDSMCKSSFVCTKLQGEIIYSLNLVFVKSKSYVLTNKSSYVIQDQYVAIMDWISYMKQNMG